MARSLGPRIRHDAEEAARTLSAIADDVEDAISRLWQLHQDSWPTLSEAQRHQLDGMLVRLEMLRPTAVHVANAAIKHLEDNAK